jgi:hypothetical protein
MKRTTLSGNETITILFLLVILVNVNLNENAFALSGHCDGEGFPICYSVGYNEGKPTLAGIKCLVGNSPNLCQGRDILMLTL